MDGLLIAGIILLSLTIGATLGYKYLMPSLVKGSIEEGDLIKKYELADIFRYKQMIFGSALLISLIFAWILVEYKTFYALALAEDGILLNVEDEPIEIIITEILPPPPPTKKTLVIEVVPDEVIIEEDPVIEDPEEEIEEVEEVEEYEDVAEEVVDDQIYDMHELEQQAGFPGGDEALLNFLQSNYSMHSRDSHDETSGMIQVAFVIEKDGTVSQVKAIRGLTSTANAEAERVVTSMPKWKPAKMGGLPVRTRYMVPFFLQGD